MSESQTTDNPETPEHPGAEGTPAAEESPVAQETLEEHEVLVPPPGEEGALLRDGLLIGEEEPERVVRQRSEYLQRTYLLIRMRWFAIIALGITTVLVSKLGRFEYDLFRPAFVLIGMAIYNVAFEIDFHFRERRQLDLKGLGAVYRSAVLQIDTDLVALTLLIYFTGGVDSPMVFFYIFHTITASYLLDRKQTFLQATLAVAFFGLMCYLVYEPLELKRFTIPILGETPLYGASGPIVEGMRDPNYLNIDYIIARTVALAAILYISAIIGTGLSERYRRQEEAIREQAITDGLTGLYNYRYFSQQVEQEFERARRYGHQMVLIMVDMDGLKAFNDKHGHLLGSQALKEIADIIRGTSRTVDVVAKYGGDEFAAILPETDKEGGAEIAERIREKVAEHKFMVVDRRRTGRLSVSGGVAVFPDDASALRELVDVADRCLYEAKQAGRNRVKVAGWEGYMGGEVDGIGRD